MSIVKQLTCPNCGANITNTKNCEYCGSLLVRFVDKGIDLSKTSYISDAQTFSGLANALKLNLQMQKSFNGPVATDVFGYQDGCVYDNLCTILRSGCCTFSDGSPIPSESQNGLCIIFGFRVHSTFDKGWHKTLKTYHKLFKNLECFPLFLEHITFDEDDAGKWKEYEYFMDFGDDYEGAARLISDVIHNVYDVSYDDGVDCYTNSGDSIESFREELLKRLNGFMMLKWIYRVKKLSDSEYLKTKDRLRKRGVSSIYYSINLFLRRHMGLYYLMLLTLGVGSVLLIWLYISGNL